MAVSWVPASPFPCHRFRGLGDGAEPQGGREGKVGTGFSLPPVWDLFLPSLHLSPPQAAPFRFQFPSLPESTSLSDPRARGSKLLGKTINLNFPMGEIVDGERVGSSW